MFIGSENSPRFAARAFTLLEIMLAVIILGMMSLAIYRFVQANVTAIRVSGEADAVEARYDGLRELMTQQLEKAASSTLGFCANQKKTRRFPTSTRRGCV